MNMCILLSQVYKARPQVFTIVKLDTRGNYKPGRSSWVRHLEEEANQG